MKDLPIWIYVLIAVLIALSANSVSAIWAREENRYSLWLLFLLFISPFVFISFGLTTSKLGLAISSGTIDALLTLSTILTGLIIFQEWNKISNFQYLGMALAICGIFLMLFFPKSQG